MARWGAHLEIVVVYSGDCKAAEKLTRWRKKLTRWRKKLIRWRKKMTRWMRESTRWGKR